MPPETSDDEDVPGFSPLNWEALMGLVGILAINPQAAWAGKHMLHGLSTRATCPNVIRREVAAIFAMTIDPGFPASLHPGGFDFGGRPTMV